MKKVLFASVLAALLSCAPLSHAVEVGDVTIGVLGNLFVKKFSAENKDLPYSSVSSQGLFSGQLIIDKKFDMGGEFSLTIAMGNGDNVGGANTSPEVILSDIWYSQSILEKLLVVVGRFAPLGGDNLVLGDEQRQFINSVFVKDTSDRIPFQADGGDAWGFSADYAFSEVLEVGYGYSGPIGQAPNTFVTDYETYPVTVYGQNGDVLVTSTGTITVPVGHVVKGKKYSPEADGYNAAEVNLKLLDNGNYRFKYWLSNDKLDGADKGPSGFSMSFDQQILYGISLGLRFGNVSDEKTLPYSTINNFSVKQTFSFGIGADGALWNRVLDGAGLAFGIQKLYALSGNPQISIVEGYYKYCLTTFVFITPSVSYHDVSSFADLENYFEYALRMHVEF